MKRFVELLEREEGFAEAVASLKAGHAATLDGVWGASCALVAANLVTHAPGVLVVLTPTAETADEFCDDFGLFSEIEPRRFPAWAGFPGEQTGEDDVAGERLRILKALASDSPPRLVVTDIHGLMQPAPAKDELARRTRRLDVGQTLAVDELTRWLAENGFQSVPAVALPGEFSLRGGIVDIFAPDWLDPVRVEFFGDQIESIRRFEIASQRSVGVQQSCDVTVLSVSPSDRAHFSDYLPAGSWFLMLEPLELNHEAEQFFERCDRSEKLHDVHAVFREIYRFPSVAASAVASGSLETTCRLRIESAERFSGDVQRVRKELEETALGQEVFVVCQTEAEARRLSEVFAETTPAKEGRLHFPVGGLHRGFRLVAHKIILLSSAELLQRTEIRRPTRKRLTKIIDSFMDLREGDLVVHVAHGIARYRGMKLLEKEDQVEEHLELEFEGKTKLYVPASRIGLVQKYVGGAKSRPKLAKLGGRLWSKQKERVQEAVLDMASDMLSLQATRASRPGIAFPPDTEWQREFDASFPYQETPDQLLSIEAVKGDMTQNRPMDRLLCGDVGFGKTEVAMRAAFKTVDAGYQVAVLVPTTVLCEQHRRTFTERMAAFPFQIASLSRFSTKGEQNETLRRIEAGEVDIVIGTHRLAQHDVKFRNLGLVILDEEQRFGVEVKERLKALRQIVDVLTMTATPIPRTLHMGLLGLRDISNLETPPPDRVAVETRIARFDPTLIRSAALRELNRGGQIFFIHNRVEDIKIVAKRLSQIIPEAKIAIAHGQMHEHELEDVMLDFVRHRVDMLLATTIVESGLDIPNANTIFIDEADRYGLADLHQLRGRVGRYKHRAYCHLLIDPNKSLQPAAVKRLKAIEEFSEMGAGFAIAMRDLEIRGAGNILGSEQSGHIAAVGYELYCSLLEQAVRHLKHLPPKAPVEVDVDLPGSGYIPRGYVPEMRLKIDLYRRLTRVAEASDLVDFRTELLDRFGTLPAPVEHLFALAEIRIAAHRWRIDSIHLEDRYVVFTYVAKKLIHELAERSGRKLRIADQRSAYLPLDGDSREPKTIFEAIKSVLR